MDSSFSQDRAQLQPSLSVLSHIWSLSIRCCSDPVCLIAVLSATIRFSFKERVSGKWKRTVSSWEPCEWPYAPQWLWSDSGSCAGHYQSLHQSLQCLFTSCTNIPHQGCICWVLNSSRFSPVQSCWVISAASDISHDFVYGCGCLEHPFLWYSIAIAFMDILLNLTRSLVIL